MSGSELFFGMGWSVWLLPLILVAPGYPFARRLTGPANRLTLLLHAGWIGLGLNWIDVALVRMLDISPNHHATALMVAAGLWTAVGFGFKRAPAAAVPLADSERLGSTAVLIAVVILGVWRAGDIARPLHSYWHTEGADVWRHEALPITANSHAVVTHGTVDSGAFSVIPGGETVTLRAEEAAKGQIILAIQGPIGSHIQVGSQQSTVAPSMVGKAEEGPVRRYLDHGVAGLIVDVDLDAGDTLDIASEGERLFVMTGADAVWALHAEGTLRNVHYYQLLNQVENQVWADEMLKDRWATLNQPPGWSPALTTATVLLNADLPAAGALFLLVVGFAGLSAVRLGHVLAPKAPPIAQFIPAMTVLTHGMLMLEPASHNFPDSLYAAAVLAVATAIAEQRTAWIAGMGIAAGLCRWPGVVVSTIFVLFWWRLTGASQARALGRLWILVLLGAILAAIGVATGVLQDLLFILYFETFPEHWHGSYGLTQLLPRVPGFAALWTVYSGGGLLIAAGCAWLCSPSSARRSARWLLGSIGIYSLMLATIDHHPTHYFLPLIWVTAVAVICATGAVSRPILKTGVPVLCLAGCLMFLAGGDVGLQPIEDMVSALEVAFNQP
jgi:hypothetical protein